MALIDDATVQRIMEAARIEDVVRGYGVDLHRAGSVLKGLCPFHDEKTPSFVVSPAKGIFKCFGCGKGGNAVIFVREKEQCSYGEALRILAKKYNIEVPERELTNEEKAEHSERQNMLALNEWFANYCTDIMNDNPDGRAVGLSYFRSRKFSDETIRDFRLGYSLPDSDAATKAAVKAGFAEDILVSSGISGRNEKGNLYDRFRGRVMFPIQNLSGKIVAFGGRILEKRENTGKYVNTPENVVYHKSNELYGMFQAKGEINRKNQCILVEGYADVISMHQSGVRNVVASCGTSLTTEQVKAIHRFTNNIMIIYDGDNAGVKAANRAIEMVASAGMNIRLVFLPNGSDPDDFAKEHNADEVETYLKEQAMDFVDYKVQTLLGGNFDDTNRQNDVLRNILEVIAVMPDALMQETFIKKTAQRFDINRDALLKTLRSIMSSKIEEQYHTEERQQDFSSNVPQQIAEHRQQQIQKQYPLDRQEMELMRFVVRHYSESVLTDNGVFSVIDILYNNLSDVETDGIIFHNPAYEKVFRTAVNGDRSNPHLFSFNNDEEILSTAASFMEDREIVSRRFDKQNDFKIKPDNPQYERLKAEWDAQCKQEHEQALINELATLVNEYKRAIIKLRCDELRSEIKRGENIEENFMLLQQMTQMLNQNS
ncbi:MAG: DNA primase [Paludibacteraceae bacterium]|nr:DNA primase [Paludibacteraceae bacterium]